MLPVAIPEEVRKELGLELGAQFVVMGEGDVVILNKIEAPRRREFLALARKVRSQARKAGAPPRLVPEQTADRC